MIEPIVKMWDVHLGQLSTVKHRVDLKLLNTRMILSVPYRAGQKEHDLEKSEIDNMLAMNVFEPAHTKWESPAVFAPKRDGT